MPLLRPRLGRKKTDGNLEVIRIGILYIISLDGNAEMFRCPVNEIIPSPSCVSAA